VNLVPPSEKQARILWASLTALGLAVLLGLAGLVAWGIVAAFQVMSSVLIPLGVAGIIACLLNPLVDRLEARGQPRARAILCVFALAALTVATLIGSVVPQIVTETRQLAERIPSYSDRLQLRVREWMTHPPSRLWTWFRTSPPAPGSLSGSVASNAPPEIAGTNAITSPATTPGGRAAWIEFLDPTTLKSVTSWLASALPKVGTWLLNQVTRAASWFGLLVGLVLVPVYAFYFLLEQRRIEQNWTDYLPVTDSRTKDELIFILSSVNECLVAFFRGQVLVAICDGILYTIGFLCVGVPYAFLLGALATVLTMIPFLGAIVICLTALVISLVQFADWLHPVLVLGVFGVVQLAEGLVISPRIMGNRVGLHPLTIIIAVMVGTSLMGSILGGILAIPLTAALRALMFRYVWKVRAPKRFAERGVS
jgi:predicted PurR-regulated permease PerM